MTVPGGKVLARCSGHIGTGKAPSALRTGLRPSQLFHVNSQTKM